jgi:hypothetical protein
MMAKASLMSESWRRLGRWGAAACLTLFVLGWASTALAATPAWWDCNYGYRKQITVSASSAVSVGHSVALTFDHASLVSAGKALSNGNDVRVLYWNGSTWTEVARGLDTGSSWNNSATKIWFKLQAAISSSSSDANYYLYYGNSSAGTPPSTWSDVFLHYDGFESGNLSGWPDGNSNGWTPGDTIAASQEQARPGTGTWSGKASTDTTAGSGSEADVFKDFADQNTVYAKVYVYLPSGFPGAGTDYVTLMRFVDNTPDWRNIITTTIDEDRSLYLWNDSCSNGGDGTCEAYGYQAPGRTILNNNQWYMIEMMANISTGEAKLWIDGNLEISVSGKNLGTNLINRFTAGISWNYPYEIANTLYIDDVLVRQGASFEPTTSLGTELAQDCAPPGSFSPCNYQYRKKITVTNNDSIQLGANTIVSFTENTQSLISGGKLRSDGKDWRIVYWNGSAHVEIDRWVKSGWNTSSTQTWFRLQAAINAGANDGNYYVYYGYAGETTNPQTFTTTESLLESYNTSDNQGAEGIDAVGWPNEWGAAQGVQFNAGSSRYWEITKFRFYKNEGSGSSSQVAGFIFTATGQVEGGQISNGKSTAYASNTFGSGWNDLAWGSSKPKVKTGTQYYIAILPTNPAGRAAAGYFRWDYDNAGSSYRSTCGNCKAYGIASNGAWGFYEVNDGADRRFEVYGTEASNSDLSATLGSEETVGTVVSYFTPDAAAAGMNVPVTFVGSICQVPTVTTNSTDIVVGPVVMTDASGNVVTSLGKVASTVFFVKPDARPATGITVTVDGKLLNQTFDIVIPTPDPSGGGPLSGRTKRGTTVLGGLTLGSGQTLTISTADTDTGTVGNQGYLPAVILVKGDVNIAGTVDVKGQNGTNAGANCTGGTGGVGGPGGGGGGGGGVSASCAGSSSPPSIDAISSDTVPRYATSKTISHTTSGTNRLMLVAISIDNDQMETVSSVTYNGTGLTLVGAVAQDDDARVEIWRMIAPPTGTYNVVVNFANGESPGSGLRRGAIIGVMTFTNVDQTTPLGTFASNKSSSGTSGSVSVSSATNELVLGVVSYENDDDTQGVTPAGGQTERWNNKVTEGSITTSGAGSTKAGASSVTISYTFPYSNHWAMGGVSIKPAPASPPPAASGGAGHTGGGGGGSTGAGGSGGAGGDGTGTLGGAPSGTTGGAGGSAMPGATGGGGGMANTQVSGGDGGGGGTGSPSGSGGLGANTDGGLGGEGGGGGGSSGQDPGGGGGGGFGSAGSRGPDEDAGYGGNVHGNAQLVPLGGGSGGAGGGPDTNIASVGAGGGGGGGAIQIYATGSVTLSGTITAAGGNGGNGYTSGFNGSGGGGGGSGGAILLQSANVTASGTLTTAGGTAGDGFWTADGGAGGTGRIRIDGLSSGSSVPGTAGSKFIGPVIDTLVDTTVKGRANGGSTVTLYVYDSTGAQVSGSPYTTSASGSSGSVGTWTISNVTFPSGTGFLAVKQTSGSAEVLGPGRATRGLHLTNWREVY